MSTRTFDSTPAAAAMAGCLLLLAALLAGGCEKSPPPPREGAARPVVFTTFYPTRYFTERIAGDAVEVVCPVPPDADPAFWMPDAATIARYQRADLIVINGAAFEKWVGKVSLPASRVVDTAASFKDSFIVIKNAITHSHGPAGKHTHAGTDGHTWLDPVNAIAQAAAIRSALEERYPEHAAAFAAGFAALEKDLRALDEGFRGLAAAAARTPILCSHPAYNYIARRYGWKIHTLDLDPETMPPEKTFASVRAILETFPARYLLWEAQPRPEIEKRFREELNVASVVFSPCETIEEGSADDYLTVMRRNLEAVRAIFAPAR